MEAVSQGDVSIVGETLEDMSLSSTSSLDRNDTSQEYMDDFDNLGEENTDEHMNGASCVHVSHSFRLKLRMKRVSELLCVSSS